MTRKALALLALPALLLVPTPAHAQEQSILSPTTWAYTNSEHPRASYVDRAVDTPVGRQGDYRARFYFTFSLSPLNGKIVKKAELAITEMSANDCSAQPPLEVWRTNAFTAPTWRNAPAELERLGAPAPFAGYQCPGVRQLDIREAVAAALARGDQQLTMELRIAASYEGGQRFGRKVHYAPRIVYEADDVAPANPPLITSMSDWAAGIPGEIVLAAQGDTDVVGFDFFNGIGWSYVHGAPKTIAFTPTRAGYYQVKAAAYDEAHNRGPEATYTFMVADTAPKVTVEMNGVGLTSRLHIAPAAGVTGYTYAVDGGTPVTVPAEADGSAIAEVVFTAKGITSISVSSSHGAWNGTITVTDAPAIGSSGWDGGTHWATVGQPLTWTFTPRSVNVVAYEYQLNYGEIVRIETPGFEWTPAEAMDQPIMVRSVHADGSTSDWSETWVFVNG